MFERMSSADGTIAIRLGETLSRAEIEALYAMVDDAFARHPRLNYFCDAEAFRHLEPDAVAESIRRRLLHLGWLAQFDRVAIVTDSAAIRAVVAVFDALTPLMEVKAFAPPDGQQALIWCESRQD